MLLMALDVDNCCCKKFCNVDDEILLVSLKQMPNWFVYFISCHGNVDGNETFGVAFISDNVILGTFDVLLLCNYGFMICGEFSSYVCL